MHLVCLNYAGHFELFALVVIGHHDCFVCLLTLYIIRAFYSVWIRKYKKITHFQGKTFV